MMDINLPKATSASIALFFAILAMLTAPGYVISIQSSIAVGYLPHSSMLTSYVAAPRASIGYQHGPTFSSVTATLEFAEPQATIFSPAPNQSVVPPGSTQQLPSDAYGLLPTYNPVLGEHLPLELGWLTRRLRLHTAWMNLTSSIEMSMIMACPQPSPTSSVANTCDCTTPSAASTLRTLVN